ncbi:hypothetical protein Asi02nite_48040 [Asanoa siamensis]|uniref:Uncharacterized protein n=1 Tax=Asanoa siamensis TaxID=926357 RepID=A0ABQ4CVH2_9ACTN|nr:hypothetical protein Asi02nite_48040 [Asanoa siamensis]
MFTDTFASIAPGSVPGFVVAQIVGLAIGVAAVRGFYPLAAPWSASQRARLAANPDPPTAVRRLRVSPNPGHVPKPSISRRPVRNREPDSLPGDRGFRQEGS